MEELLKEILEAIKTKENQEEKVTFSINEAAKYSGIGHEKLREYINKANTDLPHFYIGARVAINKRQFDLWLDKISQEHRNL